MANIPPMSREELQDFEDLFAEREAAGGLVTNQVKTLARRPEIMRAYMTLAHAVFFTGEVDRGLKSLVANMRSSAAGCRYCQAHTAELASKAGTHERKLQAMWDFEHSDLFTDAERAALRLARDAAQLPNAVTAEHFTEMRRHFSEEAIVEIMAVICLFAWLNSWNDSLATELEDGPLSFAQRLGQPDWDPGRHAPTGS